MMTKEEETEDESVIPLLDPEPPLYTVRPSAATRLTGLAIWFVLSIIGLGLAGLVMEVARAAVRH